MEEHIIHITLLPMFVASWVVLMVHPLLVKIARRKHIVDNPNARKLNKEPVPILGGVGVSCGILLALGIVGCYDLRQDICAEIIIALVLMLYTGVGDDILDFSPKCKVALQICALCMMIFSSDIYVDNLYGVWGIDYLPYPLSIGLTLFAGVGIINAINLIDGVDGLCALYVMLASLLLGLFLLFRGDMAYAAIAFATLGALFPFALHNMYGSKYKMFLGDGGSLVLGFVCAVLVLRSVQLGSNGATIDVVTFAFATLSVPICDTLRVMVVRMAHGHSPFMPDKRHLHHMLIELGLSHRATTFAMSALGVTIVVISLLCAVCGMTADMQLLFTLVTATSCVWGLYYVISHGLSHDAAWIESLRRVVHMSANNHRGVVEQLERVLNDKT